MQLFEKYSRQCMDVGREEEAWTDQIEVQFVDMRTFEARQIDEWLNERGFFHKEMYRAAVPGELNHSEDL